jgi:hypothetical protein
MADDTDDSEDELEEFLLTEFIDETEDFGFLYGMFQNAMHIDKYCNRSKYREVGTGLSGLEWVERKMASRKICYMFRMTPTMFHWLHDLLVENYGLQSSSKSSSIEALGMFSSTVSKAN